MRFVNDLRTKAEETSKTVAETKANGPFSVRGDISISKHAPLPGLVHLTEGTALSEPLLSQQKEEQWLKFLHRMTTRLQLHCGEGEEWLVFKIERLILLHILKNSHNMLYAEEG